jgi:hypothetical protein
MEKKNIVKIESIIGKPNIDLKNVNGGIGILTEKEQFIQLKTSWGSSWRKGCGWICNVSADGDGFGRSCNPFA